MGRMVDLSPGCATLDSRRSSRWIDANRVHVSEVDHERAVGGCQPGNIMPTTAYRHRQVVIASEPDRFDDVGGVCAADDLRRVAVDHRIVDFPYLIVIHCIRRDDVTANCA